MQSLDLLVRLLFLGRVLLLSCFLLHARLLSLFNLFFHRLSFLLLGLLLHILCNLRCVRLRLLGSLLLKLLLSFLLGLLGFRFQLIPCLLLGLLLSLLGGLLGCLRLGLSLGCFFIGRCNFLCLQFLIRFHLLPHFGSHFLPHLLSLGLGGYHLLWDRLFSFLFLNFCFHLCLHCLLLLCFSFSNFLIFLLSLLFGNLELLLSNLLFHRGFGLGNSLCSFPLFLDGLQLCLLSVLCLLLCNLCLSLHFVDYLLLLLCLRLGLLRDHFFYLNGCRCRCRCSSFLCSIVDVYMDLHATGSRNCLAGDKLLCLCWLNFSINLSLLLLRFGHLLLLVPLLLCSHFDFSLFPFHFSLRLLNLSRSGSLLHFLLGCLQICLGLLFRPRSLSLLLLCFTDLFGGSLLFLLSSLQFGSCNLCWGFALLLNLFCLRNHFIGSLFGFLNRFRRFFLGRCSLLGHFTDLLLLQLFHIICMLVSNLC